VFICYLDESGTVERSGTSHFVLLGLAIPASAWKRLDAEVARLKAHHRLQSAELHTAYLLRGYPEQARIAGFGHLSDSDRRAAVLRERKAELAKASLKGTKAVRTLARNMRATEAFVHLTLDERRRFVQEVATTVGAWDEVRLVADAQQKAAHVGSTDTLFGFAFEQVVDRFHKYLQSHGADEIGMLVQDNNETAANHLTELMRRFHRQGTKWTWIEQIIETPMFVDSQLTAMVQVADLCAYAVRRFFENNETDLFDRIYGRFDRVAGKVVGLRHFTGKIPCSCRVCVDHGRETSSSSTPAHAPASARPSPIQVKGS